MGPKPKRYTRMIRTINSWRGLIAITVVLFHLGEEWVYNYSVSGVVFFFVSSTFLLALRHPFKQVTAREYGRFVVSHAARIYPLHWLALALLVLMALVFHTATVNWGRTMLAALLLHEWSPVHEVHYYLNPVSWFLGALLFCYIAYPFVAQWIGPCRLRYKVLLTVLYGLVLAAVLLPLNIPQREAIFVNPLSHLLDVFSGLALFHVYGILKDRWPRISYGKATLIEVGALLLLAAFMTVNIVTTWVRPWEDDVFWHIPVGAVLLAFALLAGQEGAVGRVLLWRPLQWLGGISFEVFVLHFWVFQLFNYVVSPIAGHFGLAVYSWLWLSIPLLILISWIVNRYFTRPLFAAIKRKVQHGQGG